MAKKKAPKGSLEYNAHNGITFIVRGHEDDDPDDMSGYCDVKWKETPVELAAELRKAAEFLEKHASEKIVVECD